MQMCVRQPLRVAALLGELTQLICNDEAFVDRVSSDHHRNAAVEGVRERSEVSRTAGERDRLAADPVATVSRRLVAKRSCEPGEKPRSKLDLLVASAASPSSSNGANCRSLPARRYMSSRAYPPAAKASSRWRPSRRATAAA